MGSEGIPPMGKWEEISGRRPAARPVATEPNMNTSPHTGRILLVEADTGERLVLISRLRDAGHEVVAAESGALGISEARNQAYDLIVVASELGAGIDGFEVCRRLRAVPALGQVSIVAYSTRNVSQETGSKCYDAGADVWLGKAQLSSLEHVLRVLLRNKARCADLSEQGRVLVQRNQQLERQLEVQSAAADSGPIVDGGPGRPDGVLVVDASGFVVRNDRGARELFGCELSGRRLSALAPATGLEAFVRDARSGPREGFRFDVAAHRDVPGRCLLVSVVPLPSAEAGGDGGLRIVLLADASLRRTPGAAPGRREGELPPSQLEVLLAAARTLYRPSAIPADSDSGRALRERIEVLSTGKGPVLLRGESGTRKDFLARILHQTWRETGPFVEISCAGLSAKSLQQELFGDTQGKKSERRPGLFETTRGGTLFIREVAAVPLELQGQLREAIEASLRGRRRGGIPAPPRVVLSSEAALEDLCGRGHFDVGLLEFLSAGTVSVSPLRERAEDLPMIVRRTLERLGPDSRAHDVDEEALELLALQEWSGNERELEEILERASHKASGELIRREDLPDELFDAVEPGARAEHGVIPALAPAGPRPSPAIHGKGSHGVLGHRPWDITDEDPVNLEVYEMKALMRALDTCGGDKQAAARLLELGKSTFYRKLKRYGIR